MERFQDLHQFAIEHGAAIALQDIEHLLHLALGEQVVGGEHLVDTHGVGGAARVFEQAGFVQVAHLGVRELELLPNSQRE